MANGFTEDSLYEKSEYDYDEDNIFPQYADDNDDDYYSKSNNQEKEIIHHYPFEKFNDFLR